MKTAMELYQQYSTGYAKSLPYELFRVGDVLREVKELKELIEWHRKEIATGDNVPEQDHINLRELEDTLKYTEVTTNFIGDKTDGYILVKRVEWTEEQRRLFGDVQLDVWFCQEPIVLVYERDEAHCAEGFFNAFAFQAQEAS